MLAIRLSLSVTKAQIVNADLASRCELLKTDIHILSSSRVIDLMGLGLMLVELLSNIMFNKRRQDEKISVC